MDWSNKPQVKKSNIGERLVDEYLIKKGLIPYYTEQNKAHPFDRLCATLDKKNLVIVEVKTKPARIYYEDTGIDVKHYEGYKLIWEKYNLPIWLFFVDEMKKEIYGQKLSVLEKEFGEYPLIQNGIIYFPLCKMKTVASLTNKQIDELKKYTTRNKKYRYE